MTDPRKPIQDNLMLSGVTGEEALEITSQINEEDIEFFLNNPECLTVGGQDTAVFTYELLVGAGFFLLTGLIVFSIVN